MRPNSGSTAIEITAAGIAVATVSPGEQSHVGIGGREDRP